MESFKKNICRIKAFNKETEENEYNGIPPKFLEIPLRDFLDKDNEIGDLTALDQGHPEKTYISFIFKAKQ